MKKTPEHIFEEGLSAIFAAVSRLPEGERQAALDAATRMADAFQVTLGEKQELEQRIHTDTLTGLPNRAGIMLDLKGRLESMKRYGTKDLAVVFADLDGFKAVNDHLGHLAGDEALKQTAARLKGAFRGTDTVGRIGGDEIVLLLSYEQDETFSPPVIQNKVREALKGLVFWAGATPYPIGASIGTSFRSGHKLEGDIDALARVMMKEADEDMYADKRAKPERQQQARDEALRTLAEARGLDGPHA